MPVLLMAALSVHLQFGERGQEAGTVSALERVTNVADVACQDDTLALKLKINRTNERKGTHERKKEERRGPKLKRPKGKHADRVKFKTRRMDSEQNAKIKTIQKCHVLYY